MITISESFVNDILLSLTFNPFISFFFFVACINVKKMLYLVLNKHIIPFRVSRLFFFYPVKLTSFVIAVSLVLLFSIFLFCSIFLLNLFSGYPQLENGLFCPINSISWQQQTTKVCINISKLCKY